MNPCYNHPEKKAYSICHNCGKSFCGDCLDEGDEYFFCKSPECQAVLKKERPEALLPEEVVCPNCQSAVELSDEEMISGRVHCPAL